MVLYAYHVVGILFFTCLKELQQACQEAEDGKKKQWVVAKSLAQKSLPYDF